MVYKIQGETLAGIADSIRAKNGETEEIPLSDFSGKIEAISTEKPEETAEVALDFSAGDMTVTLSDGTVSKVLFAIAGFAINSNEEGTKDGITFIQCGHIGIKNVINPQWNYDTALYPYFDEEVKSVMRKTKYTYYYEDDGSNYTINTRTKYLFAAEVVNFVADRKFPDSEGTLTTKGSDSETDVFPLFASMSITEIAKRLDVTNGYCYWTRTGFQTSSSSTYSHCVQLKANETYGFTILTSNSYTAGTTTFPIACFRV